MAKTFIQALKDKLAGASATSLAPSATERASKILGAKEGLAGPASTVTATNEAEKGLAAAGEAQKKLESSVALAGLNAQEELGKGDTALTRDKLSEQKRQAVAEIGQKETLAAQARQTNVDVAQKEMEQRLSLTTRQMAQRFDTAVQELAANRSIEVNDLFAQFRQSGSELRLRKDAAQIEQLGFVMALRDKDYVNEIKRVGTIRRLSSALDFKKEAFRQAAGDDMEALMRQLGHQEWLTISEAELMEKLAGINLDSALAMAKTAITEKNTQAVIEGTTKLAQAGLEKASEKTPKTSKDTTEVKVPSKYTDIEGI